MNVIVHRREPCVNKRERSESRSDHQQESEICRSLNLRWGQSTAELMQVASRDHFLKVKGGNNSSLFYSSVFTFMSRVK